MPLSKQISAQNLKPGTKYVIEIQWNLTNDVREQTTYTAIGTYMESKYVRGRTCSFDTGLQMLLSRSRYETTFNINGKNHTVSSVNKFYEILTPPLDEIAQICKVYGLPLPIDLKKYIAKYVGGILSLKYRTKNESDKIRIKW